ncbi:S-adenosyl-L-methionine-dependent methyltransferase [Dichotomocladium elegans]|nr:S-adenosyl-L-methionine-dependent methyltransferase [Dichotomocladium elegans]
MKRGPFVSLAFYLAPVQDALETGIKVLDSGCGPGAWILDMATTYPDSTFVGTDIQGCFPMDLKPANCEFSVLDITNPGPFPDSYFGFIHQRLLTMGIVSSDWEKVLSNHTQTLAPGGWIEYMEFASDFISDAGPCAEIMDKVFQQWYKESDLCLHLTGQLEAMFSNAGLVNIHTTEVICSMGQNDRLSRVFWDDLRELLFVLEPIFKKYRPDLQREGAFDAYITAYAKEAKEKNTKLKIFRIWAQKPL